MRRKCAATARLLCRVKSIDSRLSLLSERFSRILRELGSDPTGTSRSLIQVKDSWTGAELYLHPNVGRA